MLSLSIWLIHETGLMKSIISDDYLKGTYILLIAGTLMALIGFLGCCGALLDSQGLLGTVNINYSILSCKTVETAFEKYALIITLLIFCSKIKASLLHWQLSVNRKSYTLG